MFSVQSVFLLTVLSYFQVFMADDGLDEALLMRCVFIRLFSHGCESSLATAFI